MASPRHYRNLPFQLLLLACIIIAPARADDPATTYLDRHRRLAADDFTGRLQLADYCRAHQLTQQQSDLLAEAFKLRPDRADVYRDLISADLNRFRPIDKTWADKVQNLMGPGYRLHHSAHFSVLTDMEQTDADVLLATLESAYQQIYTESASIGLRPFPPAGRLLTILFNRHESYRDYLARYENAHVAWSAGHYSWRTNRSAFFHDQDNPAFDGVRQAMSTANARLVSLRAELERESTPNARRFQIQQQLKKLNAGVKDTSHRLTTVAHQATLEKTRHEAGHQILFNSGLQKRGQWYPFWLAEGLATAFEAGPKNPNPTYITQLRKSRETRKFLPLFDLFGYTPGPTDDNDDVLHHYAQGWALTHFLWTQRPTEFAHYLATLDTPDARRNLNAHLTNTFGNLDDLDRAYQRHLDQLLASPLQSAAVN